MTKRKRLYREPPVIEALAEAYFEGGVIDQTLAGLFYERVRERFPAKSELGRVEFAVEVGPRGARTEASAGPPRSQFSTDDRSRMVQVGPGLVVVNQLRPYPRFEEWSTVFLEMIEHYRHIVEPASITRLGLRYIDRIVIPEVPVLLEDYFRLYPSLPPELGVEHGPFLMRIELRPRHRNHQLLVTFGSAQPEQSGEMAYMLDVYDNLPNLNSSDFTSVAAWLEEAHDNVEHAFESVITDKARQLFGVEQS